MLVFFSFDFIEFTDPSSITVLKKTHGSGCECLKSSNVTSGEWALLISGEGGGAKLCPTPFR